MSHHISHQDVFCMTMTDKAKSPLVFVLLFMSFLPLWDSAVESIRGDKGKGREMTQAMGFKSACCGQTKYKIKTDPICFEMFLILLCIIH